MANSVTFPKELGGDGNTYTDDADPNTGLDNLGYSVRFIPVLSQGLLMAKSAKASAESAASYVQQCQTLRNETKSARDAAANSAQQANASRNAAAKSAQQADQSAASVDADNIVHKPDSGLPNAAGNSYSCNTGTGAAEIPLNSNLGALSKKDKITGSDLNSVSEMQQALQVQNVAGRGVAGGGGSLMSEGAYGLGAGVPGFVVGGAHSERIEFLRVQAVTARNYPEFPIKSAMYGIAVRYDHNNSARILVGAASPYDVYLQYWNAGSFHSNAKFHTTSNTTRDSNGNLRAASPIFRVAINPESAAGDGFEPAGSGMSNNEALGVTCERVKKGVYVVTGSLGFDSNDSWPCGFTIPIDANGNSMLFAESGQSDNGTITIRTYEPLKNDQGWNVGGEPMDVPDGRFIALRLKMPTPPSDGYPDELPASDMTPEEQEQRRIEQLSQAISMKVAEINEAYSASLYPLIDDYPTLEQNTWWAQEGEARAYMAWHADPQGDAPATPVLDNILTGRNGDDGTETLENLCLAVLDNAARFTQAQQLTGRRQRLVKLARAAETQEQLQDINWSA